MYRQSTGWVRTQSNGPVTGQTLIVLCIETFLYRHLVQLGHPRVALRNEIKHFIHHTDMLKTKSSILYIMPTCWKWNQASYTSCWHVENEIKHFRHHTNMLKMKSSISYIIPTCWKWNQASYTSYRHVENKIKNLMHHTDMLKTKSCIYFKWFYKFKLICIFKYQYTDIIKVLCH